MSTTQHRQTVNRMLAAHHAAKAGLAQAQLQSAASYAELLACQEAQKTCQAVAEYVQGAAHANIAKIVSRCLEAVFDEPYEFKVVFEQKRGRTEARLVFERDGLTVDPMTASGGGVVDVASFALRLACLMLARPAGRRVLIMDEPFRFVSADYRPRVRAMVTGLASEMGVQFIIVTHIDTLRIGEVVEIS